MYLYEKNCSYGLYRTKLDGSQHTYIQGSLYKDRGDLLLQMTKRVIVEFTGLALSGAELNSHKDSEHAENDLDKNYRKNFGKIIYIC